MPHDLTKFSNIHLEILLRDALAEASQRPVLRDLAHQLVMERAIETALEAGLRTSPKTEMDAEAISQRPHGHNVVSIYPRAG